MIFDRDGTLIEGHPYNGDPRRVAPLPGVAAGLAELRMRHVLTAVASNQSGMGHGLIRLDDVFSVNDRMVEMVGSFDLFAVCPHRVVDGCACRKPEPGMVLQLAEMLQVPPGECVVVGSSGSDIGAARRAGAAALLITGQPTEEHGGLGTHAERTLAGLATDFTEAISIVLSYI